MSNDAKTTTLPNKIHHIWLGEQVKQEQLENIIGIAIQNPHYQSTIYTDNVEQMNLSIAELFIKNITEIYKIARENTDYVKSEKLIQTMKEARKKKIIEIENVKQRYEYQSDKKINFVAKSVQREHKKNQDNVKEIDLIIEDNVKEIDLIIEKNLKQMDLIIQKLAIEHSKQEPKNLKVESIDKIWQDASKNSFLNTKVKAQMNNKPFEKSTAAKEKIKEQEEKNKQEKKNVCFEPSEDVKLITTLKTEIDRLQPKHDKDIANYAQMSDILRLVTLYLYGGIYADMDSKLEAGKTLPKNYEMPVDQIFVDDEPEYPENPKSNAIIVAQKESEKLKTILQNVTTPYNQSTAKTMPVVSYYGDNPKEKFQTDSAKVLQRMISSIPKDLKTGFVAIKNDDYHSSGGLTGWYMATSNDDDDTPLLYIKKETIDKLWPNDKSWAHSEPYIFGDKYYYPITITHANRLLHSEPKLSDADKETFEDSFINLIDVEKVRTEQQELNKIGYTNKLFDNHYDTRRHFNTCELTGPELVNIAVRTELLDKKIFPINAIHKQEPGVIDWRNKGDIKKLKTRDDSWGHKRRNKVMQRYNDGKPKTNEL